MKNLLVSILFIAVPAKSETYTCSGSLERFNKPGETETKVYVRKGQSFEKKNQFGTSRMRVLYESDTDIVLGQVDQFQKDVGLFITIISKRSKTFVESYLKSSDGRHDSVSSPFGGTCIVFD